jgi:hypothetical protein
MVSPEKQKRIQELVKELKINFSWNLDMNDERADEIIDCLQRLKEDR